MIIRILSGELVTLVEWTDPIPRVGEFIVVDGKQYTVVSVTYRVSPDPAIIVACAP